MRLLPQPGEVFPVLVIAAAALLRRLLGRRGGTLAVSLLLEPQRVEQHCALDKAIDRLAALCCTQLLRLLLVSARDHPQVRARHALLVRL